MNEAADEKKAERTDRFLLEDYARWGESMYRSEEVGEKRINFFITLAAAVLAGLVSLYTARESVIQVEALPFVTIGSLGGLLLLGVVTFLRVLHRNKVTDKCKRQIADIRSHFLAGTGISLSIGESFLEPRKLRQGGLAVMMMTMNCVLAGLLLYALLHSRLGGLWWGFGGFVGAGVIQSIGIKTSGRRKEKHPKGK